MLLSLARESNVDFNRVAPPETVEADLAACAAFDRVESLRKIDIPAMVLAGTADTSAPLRYSKALKSRIRNSRLEQLEGAGHQLPLEAPALVATHLRRFLEQEDATLQGAFA
jgi:3-oxoadipate enol-lactonase